MTKKEKIEQSIKAPDESLRIKTKPAVSAGWAEVSSTKHTISKHKLQKGNGK